MADSVKPETPIPVKDADGNVIGQVTDIRVEDDKGAHVEMSIDCPFGWHDFEVRLPHDSRP